MPRPRTTCWRSPLWYAHHAITERMTMNNDETPPFAQKLTRSPDDELALRPDDTGLTVGLGLGVTPTGEPVPLVKIAFTDLEAGPCCLTLDTREGHEVQLASILTRLLKAVGNPDSPDGHALTATLADLAGQIGD